MTQMSPVRHADAANSLHGYPLTQITTSDFSLQSRVVVCRTNFPVILKSAPSLSVGIVGVAILRELFGTGLTLGVNHFYRGSGIFNYPASTR